MLKILLEILNWDLPAPEIFLTNGEDICLEWLLNDYEYSIDIASAGGVAWIVAGGKFREHGTDLKKFKTLIENAVNIKN